VIRKQSIFFIITIILFYNLFHHRTSYEFLKDTPHFKINQIEGKLIKDGVYQFSLDSALIYIKALPHSFISEHNPLFCWSGSGYELSDQSKYLFNKNEVYYSKMIKEDKTLYSIWYYTDFKNINTISQWEWRWKSFSEKKQMYLVNITVEKISILKSFKSNFITQ
jgi:hypothetical protein